MNCYARVQINRSIAGTEPQQMTNKMVFIVWNEQINQLWITAATLYEKKIKSGLYNQLHNQSPNLTRIPNQEYAQTSIICPQSKQCAECNK